MSYEARMPVWPTQAAPVQKRCEPQQWPPHFFTANSSSDTFPRSIAACVLMRTGVRAYTRGSCAAMNCRDHDVERAREDDQRGGAEEGEARRWPVTRTIAERPRRSFTIYIVLRGDPHRKIAWRKTRLSPTNIEAVHNQSPALCPQGDRVEGVRQSSFGEHRLRRLHLCTM